MTTPTIGRVMLFTPAANDRARFAVLAHPDANNNNDLVHYDAHVVYVWPAGDRVNVVVFDHAGNHHAVHSVAVIQEVGKEQPPVGAYVTWMPYQKAVAKGEIPPVLHAQPAPTEGNAPFKS